MVKQKIKHNSGLEAKKLPNSLDIIKREQDEVEFYTKTSTGESGMSESGLARLCDVAQQTISNLLQELVTGKVRSECLQLFAGKELWVQGRGPDNAKVVKDEVCAAVIEYYAFESKKQSYGTGYLRWDS